MTPEFRIKRVLLAEMLLTLIVETLRFAMLNVVAAMDDADSVEKLPVEHESG